MDKFKEIVEGILPTDLVTKMTAQDADLKVLIPEAKAYLNKIGQADEAFVQKIRDDANASALKSTAKELKAFGKQHLGFTDEDAEFQTASKRVDTTLELFGKRFASQKTAQISAEDSKKEVEKYQTELQKAHQTLTQKDSEITTARETAQKEIHQFKISEALNNELAKNKYAIKNEHVRDILQSEITKRGFVLSIGENGLSIKTKTGTDPIHTDTKKGLITTAEQLVNELTGDYIQKANPSPTHNPSPTPKNNGNNDALAKAQANLNNIQNSQRK